MANWTLQDIQNQVAVEIEGNASISSSSSDWGSRLAPINRALQDWGETYDWSQLHKIHNGRISTSTGNASYSLPSDYRKLDGFPKIAYDGSNTIDFPVVDPTNNRKYTDSDFYVNVLGNNRDSNVMYIHSTTLSSGASVQFTYWASAISLSTAGSLTECPDPSYIVQRALYYIYKSREDGRFPEAKVEADKILARMLENENTLGRAYVDRNVSSGNQRFSNWRLGRD